jgi:NTE family protein
MPYHFRNLIFEGGGVKGIAYVGAMQVLEEKGILSNIIRVGGTSVGAINATLAALGYTTDEQRDILGNLDFKNFLDSSWGIFRNVYRVINRYGWYKGNFFQDWIGSLIARKLNTSHANFKDLRDKGKPDLYVYGTNLSTRFGEVFSVERTPEMAIAEAVRISMSIPIFFAAVRNARKDIYVDGGCLNNYPVKLFDREKYIRPVDLA